MSKIGIASRECIKQRTLAVARGEALKADEPRLWFSSVSALVKAAADRETPLGGTLHETVSSR